MRAYWLAGVLGLSLLLLVPNWCQAQRDAEAARYSHVATFGQARTWGYDLKAPYDIAIGSDGSKYITDIGAGALVKVSSNYRFVGRATTKLPPNSLVTVGQDVDFRAPMGVTVLGDYVYVADGRDISIFQSDLTFVDLIGSFTKWMGWGCGLDATPGFFEQAKIYVGDVGKHRICWRFISTGEEDVLITEVVGREGPHWGSYGVNNGQFRAPSAIACAPDGSFVYVLDTDNHRVQNFSVEGRFRNKWGSQGTGPGQFQRPEGIAVGADGSVFVADTDNHRIQRFTADGQFISEWGSQGGVINEMGFRSPCGIDVDAAGKVYVCDTGNGVVRVYRPRILPSDLRPKIKHIRP